MAFNDLLTGEGVGAAWLLEVVNAAGTVLYRWATGSVVYGGNAFEGRICDLGTLERSFSTDNLPGASSLELVLDNTDSGVDFMVDRSTTATVVFQYRFRLYLALWDATVNYDGHPTLTRRQMGEYMPLNFPRRGWNNKLSVSLVDNTLGPVSDLAVAPSLNDWGLAQASSAFTVCPVGFDFGPTKLGNWDAPLPLAFGSNAVKPIIPCVDWWGTDVAHYGSAHSPPAKALYTTPLVLCVTTAPLTQNIVSLTMGLSERAQKVLKTKRLILPQTGSTYTTPGGWNNVVTLWQPYQSFGISKSGKTWYVLFILLNRDYVNSWTRNYLNTGTIQSAPDRASIVEETRLTSAFTDFEVNGYPLSAQTVDYRVQQHPVDVVRDLISFYSQSSASDIDTTSFQRAKNANYNVDCSGMVSSVKADKAIGVGERLSPFNANLLRKTLGEICSSADMDLFVGWDGKYRLSVQTNGFAEQTDTLPALPEERASSVEETIPSQGERWAPFNRVYVDLGDGKDQLGPYDNTVTLASWGRPLTRIISAKWVSVYAQGKNLSPWNTRLLESAVRPVLRVEGGLDLLQFELGDFLTFSWTRGYGPGGTPYSNAIFKVDGCSVNTASNRCVLTLVWQDDLRDTSWLPFLLDSESIITKATGSGGRTASVTDGNVHITFSTGDVVADGVVVGDFVILQDSSLAETNFTRFRALRISAINGPKDVSTDDADLDFDAPGGTTMTEWTIRAGYLGYPNSGGNYPSGSAMYGKIASDIGVYDGFVPANKLLNG